MGGTPGVAGGRSRVADSKAVAPLATCGASSGFALTGENGLRHGQGPPQHLSAQGDFALSGASSPEGAIAASSAASTIRPPPSKMRGENSAAPSATEELLYEVVHNLVVELTRTGIEVKNLTMRVESLASRVEFNERRARALESVVAYKPSNDEPYTRPQPAAQPHRAPSASPQPSAPQWVAPQTPPPGPIGSPGSALPGGAQQPQGGPAGEGPGQRSRRRRRRRGRRGGGSAAGLMGAPGAPGVPGAPHSVSPGEPPSQPVEAHEGGDEHDSDAPDSGPHPADDESQ